jgi:RNA polymerase sigma factor (sigma-70 family)
LNNNELIPHLFRTEYSKMVAVLCKTFGLSNIEIAEDVVSETFLKAVETWGIKGIPENPTAWLYQVAKNSVKDLFIRKQVFENKIVPEFQSAPDYTFSEFDFSEDNINDSLLRMIFVVCHPKLSIDSQVALALRILFGFGIDEICNALLSNKDTINKRLFRAKKTMKDNHIELESVSEKEIESRLNSVLSVLYLLFNEGYFSVTAKEKIRKDLCLEAIRLAHLLTKIQMTNLPDVNALLALFCFQTSRFEARIGQSGEQILYDYQNTEGWNQELIEKGIYYLTLSSSDAPLSKYLLEAMIAYWHTQNVGNEKEKWDNILQLYNRLLQKQYSPIIALNRTYALSRVFGNREALKEALKIKLENNPLYHSLLSELYIGIDEQKRNEHLKVAMQNTINKSDMDLLERKLKKDF